MSFTNRWFVYSLHCAVWLWIFWSSRVARELYRLPRRGISNGRLWSVKSTAGSSFRPASSTATRRPASVSCLATQPPLAPDPTTTTSKGSAIA